MLLEQAYSMWADGGPNIIGGVVKLVIDCPTGQVVHAEQLVKSLQIKPVKYEYALDILALQEVHARAALLHRKP